MTSEQMYLQLQAIHEAERGNSRSLKDYLTALYRLALQHQDLSAIPIDLLLQLFREAFHAEPISFEPQWANSFEVDARELTGFRYFENQIQRMVVDLHEMAQSSDLDNEERYFGIRSPRGHHWFNFDPSSLTECAMQGYYQCWPISEHPEKGPKLNPLSWVDLADFLKTGQVYE